MRLVLTLLFTGMLVLSSSFVTSAWSQTDDPCASDKELDTTRPSKDGQPTEVSVGFYLLDIMSIRDSEQIFTADFVFQVSWKDPRLAWFVAGKKEETCIVAASRVWRPRILIFNQRKLVKEFKEQVKIKNDGSVSLGQRYTGALASIHDLSDFPRDHNKLEFLVNFLDGPQKIKPVIDPDLMGQQTHFSIQNWYVGPGTPRILNYKIPQLHRELPSFEYSIEAERKMSFYFWKVVMPLILIIIMSWSVFWISPVHRVAQISLASAAILTTIMFQLTLTRFLPQISYLTRMDYFILFCTICVFCGLIESVYTGILAGRGEEDRAHKIDGWSKIIFPVTFIIVVPLIWFL